MKLARLAALLLALLLAAGCTGVQPPEDRPQLTEAELRESLTAMALRQTVTLGELAATEGYLALYSSGIDTASLSGLSDSSLSAPEQGYHIQMDPAGFLQALTEWEEEALPFLDSLSPRARQALDQRMATALPNLIAAQGGVDKVVLTSVLNVTTAWASPGVDTGSCYVLLLYPGPWASFTCFSPGEGEALLATTSMVYLEDDLRTAIGAGSYTDLLDAYLPDGVFRQTAIDSEVLTAAIQSVTGA